MWKIIYGVNSIVLLLIARFEYDSDSDKAVVISSFAFVVLLILNLIFGFLSQLDRKPFYKHYYYIAFGIVAIAILSSIFYAN